MSMCTTRAIEIKTHTHTNTKLLTRKMTKHIASITHHAHTHTRTCIMHTHYTHTHMQPPRALYAHIRYRKSHTLNKHSHTCMHACTHVLDHALVHHAWVLSN
jgi:hypothetical protein